MIGGFELAVAVILELEGGGRTTRTTGDRGGVTKWGISSRAHPGVDVAALTRDEAVAIYRSDYWDTMHCDELPTGLDLVAFDAAVHVGVDRATRLLQAALGVTVDGEIGPETLAAAAKLDASAAVNRLLAGRCEHVADLCTLSPNQKPFRRGWFIRLLKVREEATRMRWRPSRSWRRTTGLGLGVETVSKLKSLLWLARFMARSKVGKETEVFRIGLTLKKAGLHALAFLLLTTGTSFCVALTSGDLSQMFRDVPFGVQVAGALFGSVAVALKNIITQAATKIDEAAEATK